MNDPSSVPAPEPLDAILTIRVPGRAIRFLDAFAACESPPFGRRMSRSDVFRRALAALANLTPTGQQVQAAMAQEDRRAAR